MSKSSLLLTEIFWSKKLSFKPISTNANVENWQWKWKLGIVAIFSLPITLLHPGHAGVELQHPRINLDLRYDQDQDQRLGPGVVQEAGLGWRPLCLLLSLHQHCHHTQLTARATLHFPSLSNNYPYTLHITYSFTL